MGLGLESWRKEVVFRLQSCLMGFWEFDSSSTMLPRAFSTSQNVSKNGIDPVFAKGIEVSRSSLNSNMERKRNLSASTIVSTAEVPQQVKTTVGKLERQDHLHPSPTGTDLPALMSPPRSPSASVLRRSEPLDSSFIGLSGGQIFHEMMRRHSVKQIFGYPGGAILPIFDGIYKSKYFDFILPRHEQGGGHMAEGYARVSGKPGVVIVTSGPGATNVVTAMQDALSDGTPLVVFCGQVTTSAIGSDAFQEADVIGISRSCTKWNTMVKDIAELPRRINEAFHIATSGRPGPVLVDLPKDITAGTLRVPIPTNWTRPEGANQDLPNNPMAKRFMNGRARLGNENGDIVKAPKPFLADRKLVSEANNNLPQPILTRTSNLLTIAKRPLIYAGQGVLQSPGGVEALREFSLKFNIPVTTTLLGLGSFDELDEKRSLHMLGMHGSAYANLAMQECDLLLAVGARFDDRCTGRVDRFAPAAHTAWKEGRGGIIHFEISPKNINKSVNADLAIEGDLSHNLSHLIRILAAQSYTTPERAEWFDKIAEWKKRYPFTYIKSDPSKGDPMKPQEVIEELDRCCEEIGKDKVVLATGVGQHQMWVAQHYRWRHPRTMVTSGGLGTMGYGLPASIGAKVAAPEKTVIDIDGDASFMMTAMELATASQYNIGVKVLILNNEFQGMVLQLQDLFYEGRYAHTKMANPDFVVLAQSMGVHAIRAKTVVELPEKMKEFMEYPNNKSILLECFVNKEEHVLPMVPTGKALHEQIVHPSLPASKF